MEEETIVYGEDYISNLVNALNSENEILNELGHSQTYVLLRWGSKTMGEVYDMLHKHGYTGSPVDLLNIYNEVSDKIKSATIN